MLYLNTKDILNLGIPWESIIGIIESTVRCIKKGDFSQPVKPYLRYRNTTNRIIAMPAFVGGDTNISGIKWIASFPGNTKKSLPRAHSVIVLNEADTGVPMCMINSGVLSAIRTAAVSGLMIKCFEQSRGLNIAVIGIIGWGVIGQIHYYMICSLLRNKIKELRIFDVDPAFSRRLPQSHTFGQLAAMDTWQDVYQPADILITSTVSNERYINEAPKEGSLQLNVSLRDYQPETFKYFESAIIVDDWEEVCREDTDIEVMHKLMGLEKSGTQSITDVVCSHALRRLDSRQPVMVNPMGMAVFDIAVATYYMRQAQHKGQGCSLEAGDITANDIHEAFL